LSKIKLYEGWLLFKTTFENCKLILGDTDSICAILDDPKREFISKLKSLSEFFDFSTISKELFSTENELKHGFWKLSSLNILEVISIRQKNYSVLMLCDECGNPTDRKCEGCQKQTKGSGVPRSVLNKLTHNFYRQLLSNEGVEYVQSKQIGSKKHDLGIYDCNSRISCTECITVFTEKQNRYVCLRTQTYKSAFFTTVKHMQLK